MDGRSRDRVDPGASRARAPAAEDWLVDGGAMGELIRAIDWSRTPLGPVGSWPPSLQTTVNILLANRFPLLLWWGPEYIQLYNDPYRPVLGNKHPHSMGQPARDCWPEIWPIIGPLIDRPFKGGPATWMDDLALEVNRYGFVEETHFTVAYSPVPDRTAPNGIGGVLATVHEISQEVVQSRRVMILRDLGARSTEAKTAEEACAIAAATLSEHAKDVPFALFYLLDPDSRTARMADAAGVDAGGAMSPAVVEIDAPSAWPFAAAVRAEVLQLVEQLPTVCSPVPAGPWSDPPHSAAVLPIPSNIQHRLVGLLVLGISSRLVFDEGYRAFFELATAQVAMAIANARAYEEERKRAEALAEIDRAKTAFFSNVSHEFRTPLTLMVGPLEDALADGQRPLAPEHRERLETAHRNSFRLLKLVNTLLDFSRIEAGRVQAVYEPTALAAVTAELASNFRSAIEKAGLRLIVECAPVTDPVYVDIDMWEKIVLNLLSNAFKFTFAGEIAVRLQQVGASVELVVRDTGTGIPAEEIPHLFERFHRVQGARGRTHEGTGIGLALVQELVKLHGGSVQAASVHGHGSTFTVRIPVGIAHVPADRIRGDRTLASTALSARAYVDEALRWLPDSGHDRVAGLEGPNGPDGTHATAQRAPLVQEPSGDPGPLPRLLWADDNADMRDYVRRLLGTRYDVQAVPDGEAALVAARGRRPDLVLADIMMPRLDGIELLRALRADPATRTVPVILLSARAGEESRLEGIESGADDYLIKPFSARELLARVRAHLEMARVRNEADRRKDEFLATLSHELRSPLNSMLGWVRMLRAETLDASTARRALEVIERSVDHQSRLITDLLDINRIISGRLTLDLEVVDHRAITTGVVEAMRPAVEAKALTLAVRLGDAVRINGDAERLRQVVVNLLSNALKFTPTGRHITVDLARVKQWARLSVTDTGIGITAEFLPHVFERFRQADSSGSRAQAGLGLGLSIARHIIELHGGSIRVESDGIGQGATFTVELPIVHPGAERGGDAMAATEIATPARDLLTGVRVVIVDDDDDTRYLLATMLSAQGAAVTAVGSVGEALSALRDRRPDVVVCDLAMPGDDGFALIREVRSWPGDQGGAVPALALTAYARLEDRDRALAAGFQAHLSKPVEPRRLLEAVARLAPGESPGRA